MPPWWSVPLRMPRLDVAIKVKLQETLAARRRRQLGRLHVADQALRTFRNQSGGSHDAPFLAAAAPHGRLVAIGASARRVIEDGVVKEEAAIKGVPTHGEAQPQ